MSHDGQSSGMSTASKVIIGLVAVGGVAMLLCCGGMWWMGMRVQELVGEMANSITQNPDEIRDMTDDIVSIDVPETWQPVTGMQWSFGVEMTMVMYSPNQMQPNRALMLMQMKTPDADQQQMEQQLKMQSSQQGMNQQFAVQSSETRTIVIDGEERDFLFAIGRDSAGGTVHQVSGVFPGRDGTVMLMLTEDDDNWDEDAIVRMLESISTEATAQDPAEPLPDDGVPAIPESEASDPLQP